MRTKWVNLILKLTSLVNRKKQDLLVTHEFLSILNVFIIIGLEIVLTLISLPLYIVTQDIDNSKDQRYAIRRALSLSFLFVVLVVWLIKLIWIVALPLYNDTKRSFLVSDTQIPHSLGTEYLFSNTYKASVNYNLSLPITYNILKTKTGFSISGSGQKDLDVIVVIGKSNQPLEVEYGAVHYITPIDSNGSWRININDGALKLVPGNYWMRAMTYDTSTNTKSDLSQIYYFDVNLNIFQRTFNNLDLFLNYFVIMVMFVGIISILLLI